MSRPELSVALVGICGAGPMRRALGALMNQEGVPPLEVVVAYDPRLPNMAGLASEFPDVRFLDAETVQSPLQLVGRAIGETTGEFVLLTEDHCVVNPGWARAMWRALQERCGAVGGPIEIEGDSTRIDWAFYFVDYYRYARPVPEDMPSLSIANVGYRRDDLEALALDWRSLFVDSLVHEALCERGGPLRMVEDAWVTVARHVRLRDALTERYVFGRVFGVKRLEGMSGSEKWAFRIAAGLLPTMIMRRMGEKAFQSPELRRGFVRAFLPLWLMSVAWSTGEALGYWTGTHPEDLSVAPQRDS